MTAELIAHRGARAEAPENTLAAFQRALDLGVDGIELDVQRTSDGVPMIHHDPALPGSPPTAISSMRWDELRERSPVPTLAEVVEFVSGRCRLYVEIKSASALDRVIEIVAPHRSWCALHSFDHRVAARAATALPGLRTGILLASYLLDTAATIAASRAGDLWQQGDLIDADLVRATHGAGARLIAWTVNDPARCAALISLGVDGICTDDPRAMRNVMKRRNR